MALNPAEDIVRIWLEECKHYFTKQNVIARKPNNPKKKGGKKACEIDILATNGKKNIWVEVSVSTNPYKVKASDRVRKHVESVMKKFKKPEKIKTVDNEFSKFGKNRYEKWFVFSPKNFSKNKGDMKKFEDKLKKKGIEPVNFQVVFSELKDKLNYRGYDNVRIFMDIFKSFNDK